MRGAFALPVWLYEHRLGWLLGRRFLLLTHRGRRTGTIHRTMLEVILHDAIRNESIVLSAYGTRAQWYRNLLAAPGLRVQTGRLDYQPRHRILSSDEARLAALDFTREHPLEARLAPLVLKRIRATGAGAPATSTDLVASLPLVAFRPR